MIDTKEVVGYWQDETPTESGFYLVEFDDGKSKTFNVLHIHNGLMTMSGKSVPCVPVLTSRDGSKIRFADIGAAKG